jgi:glycosyltransferase involved in cell wall biosynthesis
MQSADRVWCGTRRPLATLRRRWNVEAGLLYPPAELAGVGAPAGPRRLVLAAADAITPSWNARLDTLARWRPDLELVKHGAPAVRRRPGSRIEPASPARFAELLPRALAVVLPPGDGFDPRAVWAAAAGVPVIAPATSAAAETVDGLETRHPTGVRLDEPTDTALADGVAFVERHPAMFAAERLRAHATRWSRTRFRQTLKALVFEAWCAHLAADGDAAPAAVETAPATVP